MKIKVLKRGDYKSIRNEYANSSYLSSFYDSSIIGVEIQSNSIIYDFDDLIVEMILMECTKTENDLDEDEWNQCYKQMRRSLIENGAFVGLDSLQSFINKNRWSKFTGSIPFTLCLDLKELNDDSTT
jgi:hypothetical protein